MGSADWAVMTGSVDGPTFTGVNVLRSPTVGLTPPPGGGSELFAINSIADVSGAVVVYSIVSGYAPTASGGSILGCIKRATSGGNLDWSTFLVGCAQGNSVSDGAYLLGLEDASPAHLVLAKVDAISTGIPADNADGTNSATILRVSNDTFTIDEWLHLKWEIITQDNGDVVHKIYKNDLSTHDLGTPGNWVWVAVEFSDQWTGTFADGYFIDDITGVNSESIPYTSGYWGFGTVVANIARRSYFDFIGITKQT